MSSTLNYAKFEKYIYIYTEKRSKRELSSYFQTFIFSLSDKPFLSIFWTFSISIDKTPTMFAPLFTQVKYLKRVSPSIYVSLAGKIKKELRDKT